MAQWETDSEVSTSVCRSSFNLLHSLRLAGKTVGKGRALEEVSYGLCISARCLYLSPASLAHHSPFPSLLFIPSLNSSRAIWHRV